MDGLFLEKISLVVPCFNEEESLPLFYSEIVKITDVLRNYEFEFIFIDDGSTDHTCDFLKKLSAVDRRVKYISFSRNFGKEAALYAGFEHCGGDYAVTIDADLQDPPGMLVNMLDVIKNEDYDCVAARRSSRKSEPRVRSYFAKIFYKLINKMSKVEIVDGARDFRLMKKAMVDSIVKMGEYNRFSKGIFAWVGFRTKWLSYENQKRVAGTTKWSFWSLFLYSIEGIIGFSTAPLAVSSVLGIVFSIIALIAIFIIIFKTLIWGDPVAGWPALACIIMLVGGLQLLCLGIIGQYLAKTYLESKHRPIYLTKETNIV